MTTMTDRPEFLNITAAAMAYLDNHHPRRSPIEMTGQIPRQEAAAQTAAEELWHALTGMSGQDAMDYAEHLRDQLRLEGLECHVYAVGRIAWVKVST